MATRSMALLLLFTAFAVGCGDDDGGGGSDIDAGAGRGGTGGTGGTGGGGTGGGGTGGGGTGGGGTGGMDEDAGAMDAGTGDGMEGERRIIISAFEFAFSPDAITALPGETLIVELRNDGLQDHNITFELPQGEIELEDNVAPGESAELTVPVPDEPGDYVFYCPIAGHRQLGMEGTLTVE